MSLIDLQLQTARLRLRALGPEDVDAIFRAFTPAVARYMEVIPPKQREDSEQFVTQVRARMQRNQEFVCAIEERATGRFFGCAGVHELKGPMPEAGIWIAEEAQGSGRGLETITALRDWVRTHRPDASHLRYPVDRANVPSRRIAEKLHGTIENQRRRRTEDGRELDIIEFHIPLAD
ncbi:MAG: GNAT family N-acetyltransferase [Planctomycetota bacterium]